MSILLGQRVLVLDTETTGYSPAEGHDIIEVARVAVDNGAIADTWASLVQASRSVPYGATRVHGITDRMLAGAPEPAAIAGPLRAACGALPLAFHNALFDLPFLDRLFVTARVPSLTNPVIDTLGLARGMFGPGDNSLGALATRLGFQAPVAHRALDDATMTARLFIDLAQRWERERGVRSLDELAAVSQDLIRLTQRRPQGAGRTAAA